jgi:hypothetical protein
MSPDPLALFFGAPRVKLSLFLPSSRVTDVTLERVRRAEGEGEEQEKEKVKEQEKEKASETQRRRPQRRRRRLRRQSSAVFLAPPWSEKRTSVEEIDGRYRPVERTKSPQRLFPVAQNFCVPG